MIKTEEVYKIGRIGKPHGVKGETTMQFSDDVFDRTDADYVVLDIDGIMVPFFFEEYRFRSDSVALVKFCDIDTLEQAKELTGCNVFFPRSLSDADDESMTWAEIVGYRIIDDGSRQTMGEITAVDDTTINVLFEVKTSNGRNIIVPASEELIVEADHQQRVIHMNIPDGILEI